MNHTETLSDFYEHKFGWVPKDLDVQGGHFNVFDITPQEGGDTFSVPYKRRDFYSVGLVSSEGARLYYADKLIDINGYALVFSNPMIPYSWEGIDRIKAGKYCIFNQSFFYRFTQLSDYPVFQSGGIHVFPLTEAQYRQADAIFVRMKEELHSSYTFKDDVVRICVLELLHFAMKMHPDISRERSTGNAAERIVNLMYELLERQFPIDETHPRVKLHSPSDFAAQLNIHVNHLNRSLKDVTGKTTGEVISERFLIEAKKLLLHSPMSIAQISFALGFSEPTRFNAFFKRHTNIAPSHFRRL